MPGEEGSAFTGVPESTSRTRTYTSNHDCVPDNEHSKSSAGATGDGSVLKHQYQELSIDFQRYREATDRTLTSLQATIAAMEGKIEGQTRQQLQHQMPAAVDTSNQTQASQRQTAMQQPNVHQRNVVTGGYGRALTKESFCTSAWCAHRPHPHLKH